MINKSAFKMSLLLCAVIFSMLSCTITSEAPDTVLLPDDNDSVLFAVNTGGEIKYDPADSSANFVGGKYGFIDRSGNIVIESKFDSAGPFDRGLARVTVEDSSPWYKPATGYFDKDGNYVWEPTK